MHGMYLDAYVPLIVLCTFIGGAAQAYINKTYKKWSYVPAKPATSGQAAAEGMLRDAGATQVGIKSVGGTLSDYYDPRDNCLHLSSESQSGGSVASVAVACHEAGHAIQAADSYVPYKIRSGMAPVVSFSSQFWFVLFIMGVLVNVSGLVTLGIALFGFTVIFSLATLPVEINASHRAVEYLGTHMDEQSREGARQVLFAAALTYVAAALISVLQFVQLLNRSRN